MTGATSPPSAGSGRGELFGAGWSATACVWIALLLVATAGRSFNAGPWRVYVVAAAATIGLCFCAARAAGVVRFSLDPALRGDPATRDVGVSRALAVLALGAIAWNAAQGAANTAPLCLVAFAASAVAVVALAFIPHRARSGKATSQATRRADRAATLAPAIAWWSCAAIAAGIHAAAIIAEPFPAIDVLDHLRRAGDVLWTGANPYASPVPDFWAGQSIYGFDTPGFPYPPVVLSVAALGRGLGLDLRWLLLGAALATSALTRAVALRSGWSREVAALLGILALSVPRQSYLIVSGFSEPLSGLLLTAALWLWLARRRAACFAALGLFVTSKQYLLVAAPLLALACASVSELLWLAGGAVVLWLPFAAWGPAALWNAAFGIHLSRPPRADGLTLSAFRMARGGDALAPWVPLLSGSAVAVLAGLPRPATPASLCLGLAGVLTLTLFLSPQAFSNYYLLTSWVLIAAIACLPTGGEGGREV